MEKNLKINNIKALLLALAVVLYFLYTMQSRALFFITGTICALPGIADMLRSKNNGFKIFAILVTIGSVMNLISTSYGVGGTIIFFVCCGITYISFKNLKVFFEVTLILCIWLISFLYYKLIVEGTVNGDIFLDYGLSKNYPGSLLVMFNCLWAFWKHMRYKKMPLLLPLLSTIMCFLLDGRSSLICMILLTLVCFLLRGKHLFFLMLAIAAFLIAYFWGDLMDLYELTSISSKGMETSRTDIWSAYCRYMDPFSFIFGLDTDHLPVLKDYGGNPHNSFLAFHRRMGLLGVLALLYYITKSFIILFRKKEFINICLLFILLLRSFFDGMLVTPEDFFMYVLIFMPICYNNNNFNVEKQFEPQVETWYNKKLEKIIAVI